MPSSAYRPEHGADVADLRLQDTGSGEYDVVWRSCVAAAKGAQRAGRGPPVLKKILKSAGTDAFKYFPVRLVPALTSLITVPVFTRLISRADYGDFYLVSSTTSLAAALITSWLTSSIVRFYWAEEKEGRLDEYVATVVWSSLAALFIGCAFLGAGVLLLGDWLSPGVLKLLPIGIAGLAFGQFVTVLQQVLRASNRASKFAVLSVTSAILATILSVYFVVVPRWGAYGILAGVALGNVVLVPLALHYMRAEGSISPRHFSPATARQFATYGVPMIPAAVSSWVLILSDRYIIGLSQSASQVGLYGTAYSLGDKIMNLITLPLLMAIGPVMVHTFEKQGQKLAEQVQTQLTRYYAMATVPLAFGLAVLAKPFMQVFTGPAYRSAYRVLPVVAFGVLLYGMSQIASNGLAMHKKTVIMMQNTAMAAVFQVCMNLWLVPKFGYPAAAWNTLASYLLLLVFSWFRSRKYMEWRLPWADMFRILAAAGAMAIVLYGGSVWLQASVWLLAVEAVVGIAVYSIALRVLRGLRPDEIEFFGELWLALKRRLGIVRSS
jgi:O-antigen/teichoic acid export membrane protein